MAQQIEIHGYDRAEAPGQDVKASMVTDGLQSAMFGVQTRPLATLGGHASWVYSLAFSPDGRHLAAASSDHTIGVWECTAGWRLAHVLVGHTDSVYCVAFSPDGQLLASGSADNSVRLWDIQTGEEQELVAEGEHPGHLGDVTCVAFSPWDTTVLVSGDESGQLLEWPLLQGRVSQCEDLPASRPFQDPEGRTAMAAQYLSPTLLAAGMGSSVLVWDVKSGACLLELSGHADLVRELVVSPCGCVLLSASLDGTVMTWDISNGAQGVACTGGAAVAPAGAVVLAAAAVCWPLVAAVGLAGGAVAVRMVTGLQQAELLLGSQGRERQEVTALAFGLGGRLLASARSGLTDHTIDIWALN